MDMPPNWDTHAAGPIGAALALLWTKAGWQRSIALLVGGSAAAYYGAPYAAGILGMPEGLTGLLMGLVSMSVAGKLFETWDKLDLVQWAADLRKRWLGV